MGAQQERPGRVAKLTRALAAAATAAAREYRLAREEQAPANKAATDAPSPGATPENWLRRLPAAAASRLLYLAFLAALPATLVALFNVGAVFGNVTWDAWLTIAAGAILMLVGLFLASNWLTARDELISQLRPHSSRQRKQTRITLLHRLSATTLKLVSVIWILLGLVALIRGSSKLN
jgi:hypothetical protein